MNKTMTEIMSQRAQNNTAGVWNSAESNVPFKLAHGSQMQTKKL